MEFAIVIAACSTVRGLHPADSKQYFQKLIDRKFVRHAEFQGKTLSQPETLVVRDNSGTGIYFKGKAIPGPRNDKIRVGVLSKTRRLHVLTTQHTAPVFPGPNSHLIPLLRS